MWRGAGARGSAHQRGGERAGAQVGAINVAGSVQGAQVGAINVAGSVQGAQVGAINVAGRVRGVQVGAINIAEDADFALGVVSVVRRGRSHVDVWGADSGLFMAAFKHGGRYFHNLYGAGVRPFGDSPRLAFSLGIGGHIPVSSRFFVDVDTLGYSLLRTDDLTVRPVFLAQARALVGARLSRSFALVAGPSYNMSFAGSADDASLGLLGSFVLSSRRDLTVAHWPGATLGAQMF
ncbi:MAG: hypothetical protein R3F14_14605 [Polyangiaceae bacterium]